MEKTNLRRPFFVINPKSYLYGADILKLAKHTDALARQYDIDVLFTAQSIDIPMIKEATSNLLMIAQHMDGLEPGKGMGHVLPEALKNAGVVGTFLNHAEHPMSIHQLATAMHRCDKLGILTIVCADSVEEAKAIAMLYPDVMVCEPTSLIGTGKVSDEIYMKATNQAVKGISKKTKVLQAAGISTGQNVYDAIMFGADGTGGTSGIVCAQDPEKTLDEMFIALNKARNQLQEEVSHDSI